MSESRKTGRATVSIEEVAISNMLLVEAVVELLVEKKVLDRKKIEERVKKLRAETTLHFPQSH